MVAGGPRVIAGMSEPTTPDPIETAAAEPATATVDGQTVNNRSIGDLIAADRYAAQKRAAASGKLGIGIGRLRPGSAVGE